MHLIVSISATGIVNPRTTLGHQGVGDLVALGFRPLCRPEDPIALGF